MAKIFIDGREYEVNQKQNLLHACLSLGLNLPYFCWHPAMGSVGACRQCAVKQFRDEKDTQGKMVMACMTPAQAGTRVSLEDPDARVFRAAVIEGLMVNHPHDCPVCDEGGECHLQDMTVMTGHNYRRFQWEKRTFRNQNLGPLINHEMNRCIQCYRCVRFYREHAGGEDLHAFGGRNIVYFGRDKDGVLENEFAGNLVEVCPTGVFTDKTLKQHYTRKWDLQMAPSVCVHCSLGCNTSPGERYKSLRRILNRYHHDVNGYFLCDRGRFGYEFTTSPRRTRQCLLKQDGQFQGISGQQAVERLASLLFDKENVIGIGSPRASLEANYVLRSLVGPERFYAGAADDKTRLTNEMVEILRQGPPAASLREIEEADAVLVLGEDLTNTAPRMALAVRQAARQQPMKLADKAKIPRWHDAAVRELLQGATGPVFVATPQATKLDDVARPYRGAPEEIARLGFAIAHALDPQAPDAPGLAKGPRELARHIAEALKGAERPAVIAGASLRTESVVQAATNVARALQKTGKPAKVGFVFPECNSAGLSLLGGQPLSEAFRAVEEGRAQTVIVLENDLYRRAPSEQVDKVLGAARQLVVLDCLAHRTGEKSHLYFAAGSFAESDGTLVNNEGRAQRFFQVYVPDEDIRSSWRWLRDVAAAAGRQEVAGWRTLDDVLAAMARDAKALERVPQAAADAQYRLAGARFPRQPHRYSGRTAMRADRDVHEPKPPEDPDSPLAYSMEGYPGQPPAGLTSYFWRPGFNSIQSSFFYQREVGGPLKQGAAGVRLLEPQGGGDYFPTAPKAFEPRKQEWLLVPLDHIFGSEELSRHGKAVMELAPQAYLALGPEDAERLKAEEGREVKVQWNGIAQRLPVRIRPGLPKGVAGLPTGTPPLEGVPLPVWARIGEK